LYVQLARLLAEHDQIPTRREDAASLLFASIAPKNPQDRAALRPVIYTWFEVTAWFEERAHLSLDGIAASEADLRAHFDVFETTLALMAKAQSFYEVTGELDEILADANS
jgi:hypothetical protein